jgi:hypothetical protein
MVSQNKNHTIRDTHLQASIAALVSARTLARTTVNQSGLNKAIIDLNSTYLDKGPHPSPGALSPGTLERQGQMQQEKEREWFS